MGLTAYAAFQRLPGQRDAERQRAAGWLVAASLLLNGAWMASVQAGLVGLSLAVMAGLLAVLLAAMRVLNRHPALTRAEVYLMDVPVGLYSGWILVAAGANAASWFTVHPIDIFGWGADVWAVCLFFVLMCGSSRTFRVGHEERRAIRQGYVPEI